MNANMKSIQSVVRESLEGSSDVLKLAHISDLHFTESSGRSGRYAHDPEMLQAIEERLRAEKPDHVIVSGDVSNYGDVGALSRARDWLEQGMHVPSGGVTGLGLQGDELLIVPGNHDAYNGEYSGLNHSPWQRSLDKYNSVFGDYMCGEDGCTYRWLPNGGVPVFVALVDSSYLDDDEAYPRKSMGLDRVAKGKISARQSELLLEWHDRGLRGELEAEHEVVDEAICRHTYRRSLRILVMHHYLFSPPGVGRDYLMRVSDRDRVVRNIVLADYDLILCGHKHVAFACNNSAGTVLDPRAKHRYLLNSFRREVGLHSAPLQCRDGSGRYAGRLFTMLINLFSKGGARVDDYDRIVEALEGALDDPNALVGEVMPLLRDGQGESVCEVSSRELIDLQKHILSRFGVAKRRELARRMRPVLRRSLNEIASRPLVQSMAGSSAKTRSDESTERSLNIYKAVAEGSGVALTVDRYSWNAHRKTFEFSLNSVFEFQKGV